MGAFFCVGYKYYTFSFQILSILKPILRKLDVWLGPSSGQTVVPKIHQNLQKCVFSWWFRKSKSIFELVQKCPLNDFFLFLAIFNKIAEN